MPLAASLFKLPWPQIPNHRRLGLNASGQINLFYTHALRKKIQRSTHPKRVATQPAAQVQAGPPLKAAQSQINSSDASGLQKPVGLPTFSLVTVISEVPCYKMLKASLDRCSRRITYQCVGCIYIRTSPENVPWLHINVFFDGLFA